MEGDREIMPKLFFFEDEIDMDAVLEAGNE